MHTIITPNCFSDELLIDEERENGVTNRWVQVLIEEINNFVLIQWGDKNMVVS